MQIQSTNKNECLLILVNIKKAYFPDNLYEESVNTTFNRNCDSRTRKMNMNNFRTFILNRTSGITDTQIDNLFTYFDKNKSGQISYEEFKYVFTELRSVTTEQIHALLQKQNQQEIRNLSVNVPGMQNFKVEKGIDAKTNQQVVNVDVVVKQGNTNYPIAINMDNQQYIISNNNNYPPPQQQYQQQYNQMNIPPNPLLDVHQQQPQNNPIFPPNIPVQQYQRSPQINNFIQSTGSNSSRNQIIPQNQMNKQQGIPQIPQDQMRLQNIPQVPYNQMEKNQKIPQTSPNQIMNKNQIFPQVPQNQIRQNQNIPQLPQDQMKQNMNNPQVPQDQMNKIKYPELQIKQQEQQIAQNLTGEKLVQQKTPDEVMDDVFRKLGDLRNRHASKQIDLSVLLNYSPSFKISFPNFLTFLSKNGAQFQLDEQSTLKMIFPMNENQEIYIKEFFKQMGLKVNEKPKEIKPKEEIPQQINKPVAIFQQQKLIVSDFIVDDTNEIDVMRSSIHTKRMYEIEEDSLPGYSEFVKIFKQLSASNKEFEDTTFRASQQSLQERGQFPKYEWNTLQWLKPAQFVVGNQYKMFTKIEAMLTSRVGLGKLITPYDIVQGILGDCYFLSALSSLAINPERILKLFITRIVNPYGIYCVKICYDGEWKAVYVDDSIPCQYKKPAFTKANQQEIWVLILEKAWAKLFGSYAKIESGFCREALRDLTGAPTKVIYTYEEENINGREVRTINQELPGIIQTALSDKQNKFVLTAGAESEDVLSKSQADRLGLINSHAYSIIKMKEVVHPQQGKVTLVQLRNPWGKKEWQGDWSDSSPLWTPELKNKLKIVASDNGIFYMSLQDFQQYFSDVTICYYHNNFQYNSFKVNQSDRRHSKYFTFKIDVEGAYYFSIVQPNKRNFRHVEDYKYSTARLFISKIKDSQNNDISEFIGGLQRREREVFVEAHFTKGIYLIQTKLFLEYSNVQNYVISSYGVNSVNFKPIQKNSNFIVTIKNCLLAKARVNPKMKVFTNERQITKVFDCEIKLGFGYYYIKNNSNKIMDLTSDFNGTTGIRPMKPDSFPLIKSLIVPGQESIVYFKVDSKGYGFKCSESFLMQDYKK